MLTVFGIMFGGKKANVDIKTVIGAYPQRQIQ